MSHIPAGFLVIKSHLDIERLPADVHQLRDRDTAGADILDHAVSVLLAGENQPIDIVGE